MPTLDWLGKEKVINHHNDVPYRVLKRQYSFDEHGIHEEDNHSENMIVHRDNLEALKWMKFPKSIVCVAMALICIKL